jgi:hypothetical protein
MLVLYSLRPAVHLPGLAHSLTLSHDEQVSNAVRLASGEVARLQGQLADLDFRHDIKQAGGSLDGSGRVPWQHVGTGTRPHSPSKRWDPADAELTFQ